MRQDVPVSFEHEGKEYTGHLAEVPGAGVQLWHVMINKYYWGQISNTPGQGIRYHSQSGKTDYLNDYFEATLISHYQ